MLRHLRINLVILFCMSLLLITKLQAQQDIQIADNLIKQNDCDNALTILVSVYKSKKFENEKALLKKINQCAEKVQNYNLFPKYFFREALPHTPRQPQLGLYHNSNDTHLECKYNPGANQSP